jgi:hypothetical protein
MLNGITSIGSATRANSPLVKPMLTGAAGGGGARSILGTMHEGGEVPKDGAYELEKGEKVTPAKKKEGTGRNSEYRKVYEARKNKK